MKKGTIILIGIGVIIFIFAIYAVSFYNSMITKGEAVDSQWAKVEVQYQRRLDLIPNLVAAVQGSMKQEQEVFGMIAAARSKYAGATSTSEKAAAATAVESSMARLLVVMEQYPELKSNANVNGLMVDLAGTENRISVERSRYNDFVKDYNVGIKRFPANMFAGMFGFTVREFFEAAAGAEIAPKVEL